MDILGVRVRVSSSAHDVVVLLQQSDGALTLPILIGPHEGVAIAAAQSGLHSPRPGPYELLLASLNAVGSELLRVHIVSLTDGTFIAELVLTNDRRVDSRASDAIALAVRAGVGIWCAEAVLAEAGVELLPDGDEIYLANHADPDEEVAEFRHFLDTVSPEDFLGEDEHEDDDEDPDEEDE
ncbi:bifunctional nuclease family protein [Pseudactinotalea sp. HY160]|nr:bifunctional nuclease family protein [Pseudactinotalea sp. HY160]QGH70982.1 bifunctional nuclease family protein [Pseudactinotalea sp. HY158]